MFCNSVIVIVAIVLISAVIAAVVVDVVAVVGAVGVVVAVNFLLKKRLVSLFRRKNIIRQDMPTYHAGSSLPPAFLFWNYKLSVW